MAEIAPAVLADNPQDYKKYLNVATDLSDRIQVDIDDGEFSDNATVNLTQVYWPDDVQADLHLMVQRPTEHLPSVVSLSPSLAIIHAEADGDLEVVIDNLELANINTGLALLQETEVAEVKTLVELVDHVLIFTGDLGHYGGETDMSVLGKIKQAKNINPDLEVGVDGGINADNAAEIVRAGADVLSVGSFIQQAVDPAQAYSQLKKAIESV